MNSGKTRYVVKIQTGLFAVLIQIAACKDRKSHCEIGDNDAIQNMSISVKDQPCFNMQQQAIRDFNGNHARYYVFGIVMPEPATVKRFKTKYNIDLISKGCLPGKSYICYNTTIDSLFYRQNKITITEALNVRD
jgi:hypothetical protein